MAARNRLRAACLVLLLAVAASRDAGAWMTRFRDSHQAGAVAVDAAGNVLTAIVLPAGKYSATTAIVKVAASSGHEGWRHSLESRSPVHSDVVNALRVVSDGDAIAAATVEISGAASFVVLRLDGASGHEHWRRVIHGQRRRQADEEALDAAVDAHGDVLAAGFIESALALPFQSTKDFAVVKLDGTNGAERWRFVADGTAHDFDVATNVAVDAAGDVLAAGSLHDVAPNSIVEPQVAVVVKLSGDDGHLLWRHDFASADITDMAVDAAGDVLVAGLGSGASTEGNAFGVTKIDGATGTGRWQHTISATPNPLQRALSVIALPSGDVAAAGSGDLDNADAAAVAVFDGATGTERWHRLTDGTLGYGLARAVTFDSRGDVVVGTQLRNEGSCYDISVLWLAGSTGAVVATRTIDGKTQATICDRPVCDECPGPLPPSREGADQDDLSALAVGASGHTVVSGSLSDGKFGRQHGFVAKFPLLP